MIRKSNLIEIVSKTTNTTYSGEVIEKNNYTENKDSSFVVYRSDTRPFESVKIQGFSSQNSSFENWGACLQLDRKNSVWQAFNKTKADAPTSLRAELTEIHVRTTNKITDLSFTSCVSLTQLALVAPRFPYWEDRTNKENSGIRYLYAVHVDHYFDAHDYEKKLNPKNPAISFEELAVRDIPPGHILAALKVNVTLNAKNKTKYEACDENIIWNVDAIDEQGRSYLRGVPQYFEKRKVIEAQFGTLLNSAAIRFNVPTSGTSINVVTEIAEAKNNNEAQNNNNANVSSVVTSSRKIEKERKLDLEAKLRSVGFFKRTPKILVKKDPFEQFKKSFKEELIRQATNPLTGEISPPHMLYVQQQLNALNKATPKEYYDYCINLAEDLLTLFQQQQKQGSHVNAQNMWDSYKNTMIIAEELRQAFPDEIEQKIMKLRS